MDSSKAGTTTKPGSLWCGISLSRERHTGVSLLQHPRPVLPYQHQLDVLSRVTGDPVMRFLLADEVGLGKTIEAGLVMRQLLLDDPHASIVVLVPRVLVSQWINELVDRLALDRYMARVLVAPYEAIAEVMTRQPDLLVIDEAHRMAELARRNEDLERRLTQAAHNTPGLLLLTATPMHCRRERIPAPA